jgi:prophage endopeptidase
MTPLPWGRILAVAALALGLVTVGWGFRGWKADAEIADLKAEHAQQMRAIAETAARAATEAAAKQERLNAANAKIDALQGDMTREKADNARLRADVATGRRIVRIAASCPAAHSGAVREAAAPPGVDPPAAVELPATVGQDILDLRAGIQDDQGKLAALQLYATTVCQGQ